MTAATQVQPGVEEQLRTAADNIADFLAELRSDRAGADNWWSSMRCRCQEHSELLRLVRTRIKQRRERVRTAIDDLLTALSAESTGLVKEDDETGFGAFQDALRQRYDEFVDALRARRIDIPHADLVDANREPKLKRALFHVGMGVGCAALYQFAVSRNTALLLLAGFIAFFGSVEVARRFSKKINDFWVDRVFGAVARPQERYRTNSATYYMLGMGVITLLAPKAVACAALLVLAVGDPIASAIGHRWGLVRFRNGKSLGGSLAFLLASSILAMLYLGFYSSLPSATWIPMAAVMVSVGALTEFFSGKIDDNFAIPVAAAAAGVLMLTLFG